MRPPREVVFLAHTVRLQPRLKVFRQIEPATRCPARRLDRLRRHIMIRVLLVMAPRVIAENGIDLQQPEQKYQTAPELCPADVVHAMVPVTEIENLLHANRLHERLGIALIRQHRLSKAEAKGVLFIVAGANEISGVALVQKFGNGAERKDRAIIQMRGDESQHFTRVRRAGCGPLDNNTGGNGRMSLSRQRGRAEEASGDCLAEKIPPFHILVSDEFSRIADYAVATWRCARHRAWPYSPKSTSPERLCPDTAPVNV